MRVELSNKNDIFKDFVAVAAFLLGYVSGVSTYI